MGILSGPKVRQALGCGSIVIKPFDERHLGPNSYDLSLAAKLLVYDLPPNTALDVRAENPTREILIPSCGYVLEPGCLYLGSTIERAGSTIYVPCIEGRSSMARLGLSPHVSAGFGDHGFCCQWTLELTVTHPVRVYVGTRVCQVFFHEMVGESCPYNGKYASSEGVVASKSHEDWIP
jgi:deoxycytidine triphosphate deaminase